MNKALFWDFDGTLVYSVRRWQKALYDTLTGFGYDVDNEEIRSHFM